MKHSKRGGVTFDAAELEEMAEKAKELQNDPKMAQERFQLRQWVWFQMLERIIENPPDTRSGLDKARWAMQQYNELAGVLFHNVGTEVPKAAPARDDAPVDGAPSGGARVPKLDPPAKRRARRTGQ